MQPSRNGVAPTAQTGSDADDTNDMTQWVKRASAAFRTSTSYVDNNLRKNWDDSIRAFNNQHPNDSKYNSQAYDKRSKLFRPKTRSIIRKNEAAAAAAFFSNMDVTSIDAQDPDNPIEQASAEIMKELLQYRLTKSVPWFQVLLGGLQDAQSLGVVCAHMYWDYKAKPVAEIEVSIDVELVEPSEYPQQGMLPEGAEVIEAPVANISMEGKPVDNKPTAEGLPPVMPPPQIGATPQQDPIGAAPIRSQQKPPKPEALVDKPVVDLIPIENIRIDPASNWMDPIGTSPYIIHLIPMYAMDVKAKIKEGDWSRLSDGTLRTFGDGKSDSTRSARQAGQVDRYDSTNIELEDYETIWVQRHIHRIDSEDWEFYCLGGEVLLSEPRPLKETVFHGKRPYVMGCCLLEAHKIYPSSIPQLGKGLQDEANEIANQRIDNIKFVLNKKWFIKRGKDVDVNGLIRNVPGGVVSMDDPQGDVREISWPDVTSSAYEEQSRVDNDMNDLLGNFSAAQVMADHGINGPARNMAMLGQQNGTLVEYLLRTYVETFVQPVLRHLVMLEQEYETDEVVLAIAAKKAQLLQKYGIDLSTDQLLNQELTLNVNVGMGATDPQMKLQKFISAVNTYAGIAKLGIAGLNMTEVGKELFGHSGYSDGTRFFSDKDPQVLQLTQQLQQAQQALAQMNQKLNDKEMKHQVDAAKIQASMQIAREHEDNENQRAAIVHQRALVEGEKLRQHEAVMKGIEMQHHIAKQNIVQQQQDSQATQPNHGFRIVKRGQ